MGLDPNMDSWPLDQASIIQILNSGNFNDLNRAMATLTTPSKQSRACADSTLSFSCFSTAVPALSF